MKLYIAIDKGMNFSLSSHDKMAGSWFIGVFHMSHYWYIDCYSEVILFT